MMLSLSIAASAVAQEAVPFEKAQNAALKVNAALGRLEDVPFNVDPDTAKPQALHANKVGVLILPDKKLSLEKLVSPSSEAAPVGQLWMLNAAVAQEATATVPKEKLRTVVIEDGDKERDVQLYLLGIRKDTQGAPELVVYGKGKAPLKTVPVSNASAASQEFPLQLSGRKESDDSGVLTVSILGQYKADIRLVRLPE